MIGSIPFEGVGLWVLGPPFVLGDLVGAIPPCEVFNDGDEGPVPEDPPFGWLDEGEPEDVAPPL
jgi:hypothetical protein